MQCQTRLGLVYQGPPILDNLWIAHGRVEFKKFVRPRPYMIHRDPINVPALEQVARILVGTESPQPHDDERSQRPIEQVQWIGRALAEEIYADTGRTHHDCHPGVTRSHRQAEGARTA